MNPSASTTGEMKEGQPHSPNPLRNQHRGHNPSCNRLLHFWSDATSKKFQIKLCPLLGPLVVHWKHLGSGRGTGMCTFIHVVWEIALLMTHNTVALWPDIPTKFPSYWEAEITEKIQWKQLKLTDWVQHRILPDWFTDWWPSFNNDNFSHSSALNVQHFHSCSSLISLRLGIILCNDSTYSCVAAAKCYAQPAGDAPAPVVFIWVHLCHPWQTSPFLDFIKSWQRQ